MKKTLLSFILISATAFSLCFAEENTSAVQKEISFRQIMSAAFNPEKASEIRSAKLVYTASTSALPEAIMMVRARKPGSVRIDVVTKDNHYTVCQDGEQFWSNDAQKGVTKLDNDEVQDLKIGISFLPISFYVTDIFHKLTYKGPGLYQSTNCLLYKADAPSSSSTEVWLEEKTGLLCRVKSLDRTGKYDSVYRNYRDFDGIRIATAIHLSSPSGPMMMQLRSVDWNTSFPEKLFTEGAILNESSLELFQKELIVNADQIKILKDALSVRNAEIKKEQTEAAQRAAEDRKKARANAQMRFRQKKIQDLEREIRVLNIEISEKTQRLHKVEGFANSTRQEAASVAGASYSTWRYGRWGCRSSGTSTSKRAARKLGKASAEAVDEYNKLSQELMEKKIRLSDAQVALAKLKEQR